MPETGPTATTSLTREKDVVYTADSAYIPGEFPVHDWRRTVVERIGTVRHYVQDKVVIITGGSSGFGLETARILLEMDARVVITGATRGGSNGRWNRSRRSTCYPSRRTPCGPPTGSDSCKPRSTDSGASMSWSTIMGRGEGRGSGTAER